MSFKKTICMIKLVRQELNIRSLLKVFIIVGCFLFVTTQIMAQKSEDKTEHEEEHESENHGHHESKKWRLSVGIGQSYMPAGTNLGTETKFLVIPTIGLSFGYKFSPRFSLGLLTELEIITYAITSDDHDEIEREYPFLILLAGKYKIKDGFAVFFGPGIELETHENFFIWKLGVEYEIHIGRSWDVTPELSYLNKDGQFGAIEIGVAFGKSF